MADTIYAPSTAPGRAGVAVVRISGPRAGEALCALSGRALPPPRRAVRVRLREPGGERIDDGLALWFAAPASFTGEDVTELHIHGGRATLDAVLAALSARPGLRLAEPGEFTRRAFDNGKLDLTAVEGLADLVAAETAAQRRQALRQLDGELGRLFETWRLQLMRVLAHAEAAIDFPEEGLPDHIENDINYNILRLLDDISQYIHTSRHGERVREGVFVAILGAPNVGKSSLLNALARRDVAIVSDIAGTTRDVLEVHLDLAGYAVTVADTAGLRDSAEIVEQEGVRRALARAEAADLRLVLFDAAAPPEPASRALLGPDSIAVINKIDLVAAAPDTIAGASAIAVSVRDGTNLDRLLSVLTERVGRLVADQGSVPLTRERHRAALVECRDALERAAAGTASELMAEDLRLAVRALGRVTGRVGVEDLLDVVFREFCIGK